MGQTCMEMVDGSAVSSTVPFWVLCSAFTLFLRLLFRFLQPRRVQFSTRTEWVAVQKIKYISIYSFYFFVLVSSDAFVWCCSPAFFGVSSLMTFARFAPSTVVNDSTTTKIRRKRRRSVAGERRRRSETGRQRTKWKSARANTTRRPAMRVEAN